MLDKESLEGTVAGIESCRARAALAAAPVAVAGELTTNAYLISYIDFLYLIPDEIVVRNKMVVGQLYHVERIPCLLVPGLYIAGEDSVPEVYFVYQGVRRVVAPDNAYVQHIQMIARLKVHAAISLMMPVGNDHAVQLVFKLRFDDVFDTVVNRLERLLAGRFLFWLTRQCRYQLDISRQIVPIPERHDEPNQARSYHDVSDLHFLIDARVPV